MRIEILHLSLEDYDMLLLDEPTNHLDMMSISELIDALNDYEGTLVIISHDRDFVDKTCDKLLYFYNGNGYYYEGPYSEFKEKRLNQIMADEKAQLEEKNKALKQEKIEKKKEDTTVVKKTRLTREAPEKILDKIDKAEKKKKDLTDLCSLPEYFNDPAKLQQVSDQLDALNKELSALYDDLSKAM